MRQNGVRSPVRFPYSQGMKKGGKVKKKQGSKIEKMSLLVQDVEKSLLRNNLLKIDETSLMENGANVLEEK